MNNIDIDKLVEALKDANDEQSKAVIEAINSLQPQPTKDQQKETILAIKDQTKRQQAIADNLDLFK